MEKLKLSLAALGLGAALAAGPAVGAISWNNGVPTVFEDDDLDFILNNDLTPKLAGDIVSGDVLVSVFEVNNAGGSAILPDELTGVVAIEVNTVTPIGGGLANFTFVPYSGGLNAVLGLGSGGVTCPAGSGCGPGGNALGAMFLDPNPNLSISADLLPGVLSCSTLSQCIDQSVDGAAWQVDGLGPDPDDFWIATAAPINPFPILNVNPVTTVGNVNGGLSINFNGTGQTLVLNSIACFPFCGVGGDGFVDMLGTGSIQGGLGLEASLINSGAFATSDFDFSKTAEVPEPSTLALLAAGFLGVGAVQRRRRKASQA